MQPEPAQENDVALLKAIGARDEVALAHLYDRYRTILFGLLMRILNNGVNTPGARVAELKGIDLGAGATASLAYDQNGRAMLMATRLPNAPQGKAYQLWFIVGNKPPMPGKTFSPDNTGKGMLKDQMPKEALGSAIFAITMEPEGGSSAPTSPIYLRSFEVN